MNSITALSVSVLHMERAVNHPSLRLETFVFQIDVKTQPCRVKSRRLSAQAAQLGHMQREMHAESILPLRFIEGSLSWLAQRKAGQCCPWWAS